MVVSRIKMTQQIMYILKLLHLPSYNFDLGDNTDLSVIASYQHREYIRQQGLPVIGTLKITLTAL